MVILLSGVQFEQVNIRLRVQFGNNFHKRVFQRVSKLHQPGEFSFSLCWAGFFSISGFLIFTVVTVGEESITSLLEVTKTKVCKQ